MPNTKTARQVLARNLNDLMSANEALNTQEKVAAKAKVSQRSVSNMKNADTEGTNAPTLDKIDGVAKAFHLEAWQLLLNRETVGELFEFLMRPRRGAGTPRPNDTVQSVPNVMMPVRRKVGKLNKA